MGFLEFATDVATGIVKTIQKPSEKRGSNGNRVSTGNGEPPWSTWSGTDALNRVVYEAVTGMRSFHVDGEGWFGRKPGSTQTHRLPCIQEPTPERKLRAYAPSQDWSGSNFYRPRSPSAGSKFPSSAQNFYAWNVFERDAECGSCGIETTTGVPGKVTEYTDETRDIEMKPMCSKVCLACNLWRGISGS